MFNIEDFVKESNRIEGIHRAPTPKEIEAHVLFIRISHITVKDIETFVSIMQPGAKLREKSGMNVRVGKYRPPPGGEHIRQGLGILLRDIRNGKVSPYDAHSLYEELHPFTDGNGRSGRVLWLWMMGEVPRIGFLHKWYYQSLDNYRATKGDE